MAFCRLCSQGQKTGLSCLCIEEIDAQRAWHSHQHLLLTFRASPLVHDAALVEGEVGERTGKEIAQECPPPYELSRRPARPAGRCSCKHRCMPVGMELGHGAKLSS